jgi:hypothetical protein
VTTKAKLRKLVWGFEPDGSTSSLSDGRIAAALDAVWTGRKPDDSDRSNQGF